MLTAELLAYRWIEAFNRHDVVALISLYARDALHTSPKLRTARPETGGQIAGQAALAAWWQDTFQRMPGLRYDLTQMTCCSQRAFIEYLRHLPGEEPTAVAEVFEVQYGLIICSRVYHG